jgi:hypothetical protein
MSTRYRAPKLTTVASIAELTRGNQSPVTSLDADHVAGTPFEELGWNS